MSKWQFTKPTTTKPYVVYARRSPRDGNDAPKGKPSKNISLGAWHGTNAQDAMCRAQIHWMDALTPSDTHYYEVVFCLVPHEGNSIVLFSPKPCVGC